jgi:hypothetical protein
VKNPISTNASPIENPAAAARSSSMVTPPMVACRTLNKSKGNSENYMFANDLCNHKKDLTTP